MTTRSGTAVFALLLCFGTVAADEQVSPGPEPGVSVQRHGELTWLRAVVPGRLVSYAVPRSDGSRRIVVLAGEPAPEPEEPVGIPSSDEDDDEGPDSPAEPRLPPCPKDQDDGAMTLYEVISVDPPMLEPIVGGLPHDCSALDAADLDGDGRDELLIGRPGEILVVRGSTVETLLEEPSLSWRSLHPVATRHRDLDGEPYIVSAPLGSLQLYGPGPETAWRRLAEVAVPMKGAFWGAGLRVGNPVPTYVGRGTNGELLFATWPEVYGNLRMRVLFVAMTPSEGSEVVECWARLSSREEVLDRRFLMIDGRPVMFVTTKPADKLNLFGEKELYLFPLEFDRSRLGRPPLWQVRTRMNIWQEAFPRLTDVNGDGRLDLVIGYWKGIMGDPKVVLDVYLRQEEGWFDPEPRSTSFEVDDGDRSMVLFGDDVNGDGLADMIVRGDERIFIHRGLPSKNGKKLVHKKPLDLTEIALTGAMGELNVQIGGSGFSAWTGVGAGRPRLVDLDDDGKMEILVVVEGARDELWVLDVRGSS